MIVQSKAKWLDEFKAMYKGIDAQTVADEITSIGDAVSPQEIVEKARDEMTELHKCFEWDDEIAAEKYRVYEARQLVRHLVIEEPEPEEGEKEKPPVRYFLQTVNGTGYKPTETIYRNRDEYMDLLETAKAELKAFQRKYSRLKELNDVFEAINKVM